MNDNTVEQRTPKWHAQRVGRVTGSVAGGILGLSPWQTPESVLRSMVRAYHGAPSEFPGNPATSWGTKHERQAQLAFMRETGLHIDDCGFFTKDDWLGASPDGLIEGWGIAEVKVPYGRRDGGPFKTLSEQPHYYAQVQLEMLCSGRTKALFFQYRVPKGDPFSPDYMEEGFELEEVELSSDWLEKNIPVLREFYNLYLSELSNPAHLAPLRVSVDTDEAQRIVNRIGEIQDALHNLEEEKKAHMAQLVELAGGEDAEVCGRKLTRTKDSTSVAYAKALKELAPNADLAKWTTVKQGYWRLS